jgi:hypothetical protein
MKKHVMKKQIILLFVCLASYAFPFTSGAAIYKHVDKEGHVTYSNVKIKGSKKLDIAPANTSFGTNAQKKYKPSTKESTPDYFPEVTNNTQQQRDTSRKEILLSELASEKQALAIAKVAYDEGAKKPETFRNANGGTSRNVAKYEEKMKKLQDIVNVHQRNVNLLEKEISNIR